MAVNCPSREEHFANVCSARSSIFARNIQTIPRLMTQEDLSSAGCHFMIGLQPSPVLTGHDRALLSDLRPAGVILFKSNFRHDLPYHDWLESHARLIGDIRAASGRER